MDGKSAAENVKITKRQILDIIVIIALSIAVYLFSSAYDWIEQLTDFLAEHEDRELDEIIAVSFFLVLALLVFAFRRWYEIRKVTNSLLNRNIELEEALSEIKRLRGILPICAACKRIRDDAGYWHQVEMYVQDHSEAEFSHSICPDCMKKMYPDFLEDNDENSDE